MSDSSWIAQRRFFARQKASDPTFWPGMSKQYVKPEAEALAEFIAWLTDESGGAHIEAAAAPDLLRWIGYKPLMFHFTMTWGIIGDQQAIEGRFCYRTLKGVRDAFEEWKSRDFEGGA